MSLVTSWRLPLRIARREALRHRGRSVLVLVMIALPVLAVTAADVLIHTADVSSSESIDRRMGSAQALVTVSDGVSRVEQGPDPERQMGATEGEPGTPVPTGDEVSSLLGGAPLLELRTDGARVVTDGGQVDAEVLETDLSDPLAQGLVRLTDGRLPQTADEVVVNAALADQGYRVGDTLRLEEVGTAATPPQPTIVGIAESTTSRTYPFASGPLDSLGAASDVDRDWLVGGGPVSWATVQQLNGIGAMVASRAVLEDPPPSSEWPDSVYQGGTDSAAVAVVVLIVVMALIEVVLLAGPAFAVGARQQQRSLALLVATGGTPTQSRRVIVAGALVLGSAAAVLGMVLGMGVALLARPVLQSFSDGWLGPFEVPWLQLGGVAAFGLLSAFLASLVPAWIASRQDVVAVLAGRRGDRAPSLRSPVLGLVLLGGGIAGSAAGATGGGEILIAASAIPAVLGMILLVPLVLASLARVSGRLPLVLRYAVRDASRHRTRTVPAVSAVAATVAGVVALGIGLTSDQAENRETYTASLPDGVGMVTGYGADIRWQAMRSVIEREAPGVTVTDQLGISDQSSYTHVAEADQMPLLSSSSSALGASVMVSDDAMPVGLTGIDESALDQASAALREGQAVVFYSGAPPALDSVTLVRDSFDPESGETIGSERARTPASLVEVSSDWLGPVAVVPPAVADELGSPATTVSLAVTGAVMSTGQEDDVDEALLGLDQTASLYVERGYQADSAALIAQLILIGLGAVLMLGGTLTATFLALSDARPDLATLSAVGASPRTRRSVAAAYAVVVGGVGAVLGAAVGFIPGIAVTWPLTSQSGESCVGNPGGITTCAGSGPFLDVPWLMVLSLVVVLPLVTAAVVGLFARSRLPLVARLG